MAIRIYSKTTKRGVVGRKTEGWRDKEKGGGGTREKKKILPDVAKEM